MITPTLDPRGTSFVHSASALSKIWWLIAVTTSASISKDLYTISLLTCEVVTIYLLLIRKKETPAPPVIRFALATGGLLFLLNIVFAGSALGRWSQEATAAPGITRDQIVYYSLLVALRLCTTMVVFFIVTLSTIPRDLARNIDKTPFPSLVSETVAIALRFISVMEVNVRVLIRAWQVRFVKMQFSGIFQPIRSFFGYFLVGALIMAISQANATGWSLILHGFQGKNRRIPYQTDSKRVPSLIFWALGVISLALLTFSTDDAVSNLFGMTI